MLSLLGRRMASKLFESHPPLFPESSSSSPPVVGFPSRWRGARRTQLCVCLCGEEISPVPCIRNCHVIVGVLVIFAGKWKQVGTGNS